MRDVHYMTDPDQLEFVGGARDAIRRLNDAQIPVVVVTNQSGIARGLLTTADYHRIADRLDMMLLEGGAQLDGSYFCPHLPGDGPECGCRKPATLLFRRAAEEHALRMDNPTFIGDRLRDVAAMRELGGSGFIIQSAESDADDIAAAVALGAAPVASLAEAVDILLTDELTTQQ